MSNKELKQILQEIKDDCRKRNNCEGCKFDTKYGCRLDTEPKGWNLICFHRDKWHTLYSWLVDMRHATAGTFYKNEGEYTAKMVRRDLLDEILEYMNQLDEEEHDET